MKVADIMTRSVVVVRKDDTLGEVAELLLKHRIGGAPVVDAHGRLCGMLTTDDFAPKMRGIPFSTLWLPQVFGHWIATDSIEQVYAEARNQRVEEVMDKKPVTAKEEDDIQDVMKRMLGSETHHVPVLRQNVPVGIVTQHDLLRLMFPQEQTAPDRRPSSQTGDLSAN